jgi:hypothetical protein
VDAEATPVPAPAAQPTPAEDDLDDDAEDDFDDGTRFTLAPELRELHNKPPWDLAREAHALRRENEYLRWENGELRRALSELGCEITITPL